MYKILFTLNHPTCNEYALNKLYTLVKNNTEYKCCFVNHHQKVIINNFMNFTIKQFIDTNDIEKHFDIFVFSNNHNCTQIPNNKMHLFAIRILNLNKIISYIPVTACNDYFFINENISNTHIQNNILLFLPNLHYYQFIRYLKDMINNYYPDYFKSNNKYLLSQPFYCTSYIDKNDFYKKYKIPNDYKIAIFYPSKLPEIFDKDFYFNFNYNGIVVKLLENYEDKETLWKCRSSAQKFIINIKKIYNILDTKKVKLLLSYHWKNVAQKFNVHWKRSDNNNNCDPHEYLKVLTTIDNNEKINALNYASYGFVISDTSAQNVLPVYKIPTMYIVNEKYNWLDIHKGCINKKQIFGKIVNENDIFNDGNLNHEKFESQLKTFLNTSFEIPKELWFEHRITNKRMSIELKHVLNMSVNHSKINSYKRQLEQNNYVVIDNILNHEEYKDDIKNLVPSMNNINELYDYDDIQIITFLSKNTIQSLLYSNLIDNIIEVNKKNLFLNSIKILKYDKNTAYNSNKKSSILIPLTSKNININKKNITLYDNSILIVDDSSTIVFNENIILLEILFFDKENIKNIKKFTYLKPNFLGLYYNYQYNPRKFEYILDTLYINEEKFDDMWNTTDNNILQPC